MLLKVANKANVEERRRAEGVHHPRNIALKKRVVSSRPLLRRYIVEQITLVAALRRLENVKWKSFGLLLLCHKPPSQTPQGEEDEKNT